MIAPRKTADGRWKVAWRVGGGSGVQTSATFKTHADAKAFATDVEAQGKPDLPTGWARAGRQVLRVDGVRGGRSLADVATELVEAKPNVTDRTRADYARDITRHLADTDLGRMGVADVDRLAVERWQRDLSATVEAKTVANVRARVTEALNHALEVGERSAANPCPTIPLPAKDDAAGITTLTDKQWRILYGAAVAVDAEYAKGGHGGAGADSAFLADMVAVLVATGLRMGELTALTVDAYLPGDDDEPPVLAITSATKRAPGAGVFTGGPKTINGRRDVDLPPHVDAIIARRVARSMERGTPFVFPAPRGGRLRERAVTIRWAKLVAQAKADGLRMRERGVTKSGRKRNPITPHGLRHTHTTWLHDAGINPAVVAARSGHDVATSMRIYNHASRDGATRARVIGALDKAGPAAMLKTANRKAG